MANFKYFIFFFLWISAVSADVEECRNEFRSNAPFKELDESKSKPSRRTWMSFKDAKAFVRKLKFKSAAQFRNWSKSGKRPKNFPSAPQRTYKKEWVSWSDFLNTKKRPRMSFEDAKAYIREQGVLNHTKFREWKRNPEKRPDSFPSHPEDVYADQWRGLGDFLGTGNTRPKSQEWMSFKDAKAYIREQGVQTSTEFEKWKQSGKKPINFPATPYQVYEEWVSWSDFLNTKNIAAKKRIWMSFKDAKAYIRKQGVQTSTEFEKWKKSGKRPIDFPSAPQRTYKNEWVSWSDFLNTKKRPRMSFKDAKAYIRKQGVRNHREFKKWSKSGKRPKNFPSHPEDVYKDQWFGWKDFLGTIKMISFKEAKTLIRSLGIDNSKDLIEWLKSNDRPRNFPPEPHHFYSEWTNTKDFLFTKEYISFEEARAFVQRLNFAARIDFLEMRKSIPEIFPDNFPPNPKQFYTKTGEWRGWNDFLGITNKPQEDKTLQELTDLEKTSNSQDEKKEGDPMEEDFLYEKLD